MDIEQIQQKALIEVNRIKEEGKELLDTIVNLEKENEELKFEIETMKSNQEVEGKKKTLLEYISDFLSQWKR